MQKALRQTGGAARRSVAAIFLFAISVAANAAVTDCVGMAIDGQAQCIPPIYAPAQYSVCDIHSPYAYRDAAWGACYAELGVTNQILQEATAIALADCFDKRLALPGIGGVAGPVPWLPVGTFYNDNYCSSGTVRDDEFGHHLWGVGNLGGVTSSFAFTRFETSDCPAGYSPIYKSIQGYSQLVRCKPNPPCPPDKVMSPTRPGVCLTKVVIPTASKPPDSCSTAKPPRGIGNPIYPLTGAKRQSVATGFKLNGAELVLTYDTTPKLNGSPVRTLPSLGPIWFSSLHKTLGVGSGAGVLTAYRGDGSVATFALKGGVNVPEADIKDKVVAVTGGYQYVDAGKKQLESYNAQGQLTRVDTAGGAFLNFGYSTGATAQAPAAGYLTRVTDNAGRYLKFDYILPAGTPEVVYPTSGLISRVTNSAGQSLAASYDVNLNLVSLTWPDNKTLQFLYEDAAVPWAMTGRLDENASRDATWSYDAQGRAVSTSLASGVQAYSVSYGGPPQYVVTETEDVTFNLLYQRYALLPPSGVSIASPNGQSVAWDSVNVLGAPVLTGATQPAGSGCGASSNALSYDSNGNVLSRDDFQGIRTCYAYDATNRETVRVEGLANTASCASVTPLGAALPTGARKIITSWHPDWEMPTQVVQPLRRTSTVYHGQSDPFNGSATANCTPAAALPSGKAIPVICKQVEQATLSPGPSDDPYFDNVSLLLHGNGTNGSTTFIDSSFNSYSPSLIGSPVISTAHSKYGGSAISFGGSADALSYPHSANLNLASGDFTIEAWIYLNSLSTARTILQKDQSYGITFPSYSMQVSNAGALNCFVGTGSNASYPQSMNSANGLITTGNWYHVAFTRQGTTLRSFVNGVLAQSATQTGTPTDGGKALLIGRYPGGGGSADTWMSGYIDDLRITKGMARYTATFTPTVQEFVNSTPVVASSTRSYTYDASGRPLSSVNENGGTTTYAYFTDTTFSGTYDPYIDQVSLLLHGNGTDGATSIMDDGPVHQNVTVVGNTKIGTAQSKFGGASIAFDGAGDYVTIPYSDGFAFGSGDFTIETFLYKNANNANDYSRIWNVNGDYLDAISIIIDRNGNFGVYLSTDGTGWTQSSPTVANLANGQWYHLAVTRSGGSVFAFVNGTKYTVTTALGTAALYTNTNYARVIGGQSGIDRSVNGYFDEFRITKGLARYTADFTPPVAEFSHTGPTMATTGHTIGDLQSTTNAAGQVTQFNLYDPAGRVRQMTDPKGVVTDITYTPRGWVSTVTVTPPSLSARGTTYSYDDVGQLTGVAQPDGTSLSYSYDAAHRLVGATDARGNAVTYTLDNVGNRIAEEVRDPSGTLQRSIGRSFDALNRLQQVTGAAQ